MKSFAPLFVASVLAMPWLSSCDESGPTNAGFPITEAGPFGVGFRELEATYTLPDSRGSRTISVAVWYPTYADIADRPNDGLASYTLGRESTLAFLDAPPERPAYRGGFPVMVHSHGHLGYADQSFQIGEGLAQHGYVVVAPMHEGNSALDVTSPAYLAITYERPLDVTAALDLLESGLPENDPLHGLAKTDRVVVSGHSRGTNTVFALLGAQFSRADAQADCDNGSFIDGGGCPTDQLAAFDLNYRDERIVAGIPMAGDGGASKFGGVAQLNALSTSVFFLTGSLDDVGVDELYPMLTGPDVIWADFAGGCHNLFGGGGCSGVSDVVAQPHIRTVLLAYLRRHLFDDQGSAVSSILDGTAPVSAIVTLHP